MVNSGASGWRLRQLENTGTWCLEGPATTGWAASGDRNRLTILFDTARRRFLAQSIVLYDANEPQAPPTRYSSEAVPYCYVGGLLYLDGGSAAAAAGLEAIVDQWLHAATAWLLGALGGSGAVKDAFQGLLGLLDEVSDTATAPRFESYLRVLLATSRDPSAFGLTLPPRLDRDGRPRKLRSPHDWYNEEFSIVLKLLTENDRQGVDAVMERLPRRLAGITSRLISPFRRSRAAGVRMSDVLRRTLGAQGILQGALECGLLHVGRGGAENPPAGWDLASADLVRWDLLPDMWSAYRGESAAFWRQTGRGRPLLVVRASAIDLAGVSGHVVHSVAQLDEHADTLVENLDLRDPPLAWLRVGLADRIQERLPTEFRHGEAHLTVRTSTGFVVPLLVAEPLRLRTWDCTMRRRDHRLAVNCAEPAIHRALMRWDLLGHDDEFFRLVGQALRP